MKATDKREAPISIRFTRSERARLEAAAIVDGRTLSDWSRRALLVASNLRKQGRKA